MRNFKRFRDQEIVFQDGITGGIVGNNGTGKSSIVSAVLFALYGLQGGTGGLDGNYIVSSFAGPQDVCEVRLDFSVGGNEYAVVRRFKRRPPSSTLHEANLYLNQKLLASSVQKVGEEVQRVVGMGGPGDFRNTIYAGQKELLALLESRAGSRKDWFMQVLGIDYLKKDSMEHLKSIVDAREGNCRELSGRLQELDADEVRGALQRSAPSSPGGWRRRRRRPWGGERRLPRRCSSVRGRSAIGSSPCASVTCTLRGKGRCSRPRSSGSGASAGRRRGGR